MDLKYALDYKTFHSSGSPCPAVKATYIAESLTAFRLVKNPLSADDFLPPARLNGGRQKVGGRPVSCSAFALSYFETYEQAQSHRCKLVAQHGEKLKLGDHIAQSLIDPADGLCTRPDKRGHFDLYEEKNTALASKSSVSGKANCG